MIINNIASNINDMIISLQNSGISFSIIFIGLFIFNFIIFLICKMLQEAKGVYFN